MTPADDDLLHQNTTSGPAAFPYGAGMTTTPYNKNQLYYSINPDIDSHLTNYFIFPDFDNNDPLCAITNRWSVVATGYTDVMTGSYTYIGSGMDNVAIPEYNPGWW